MIRKVFIRTISAKKFFRFGFLSIFSGVCPLVKVILKKNKVEVTRELTLTGVKGLQDNKLQETFGFDIDLSGIKQGTEVGDEILKVFRNRLLARLTPLCEKQNRNLLGTWRNAANETKKNSNSKAVEKLAANHASKIRNEWFGFSEQTGKSLAEKELDWAVGHVAKKYKAQIKKPKMGFWSKENSANRLKMEKALLAALLAAGAGATTGGVGLLAFIAGAGSTLIEGLEGAFKSTQKRSGELKHSLGIIEYKVSSIKTDLDNLAPERKRLAQFRRALNTEIATMGQTIAKLETGLRAEVAACKKAGQDVDMTRVKKVQKQIAVLKAQLSRKQKEFIEHTKLEKALSDLVATTKHAAGIAKADKDMTNAAVDFFSGRTSEFGSGLGTMKDILEGFKK